MDKLKILQKWEKQHTQIDDAYKLVSQIFNIDCDSPVISPTFEMFDTYTDVVAELVGDKDEWLQWYAWENDFGKKAMRAKASKWKSMRSIKNVKALLSLIENK